MPNENRPWLFDDLPSISGTTQVYTSKSSAGAAPKEYKYTVEHLRDWMQGNLTFPSFTNYISGIADTASIALGVDGNGVLSAEVNAIGAGTVVDTNDLTGSGANVVVPLQTIIDVVGTGSGFSLWAQTGDDIYPSTLAARVGIGISNPIRKLHVRDDIFPQSLVQSSEIGGGSVVDPRYSGIEFQTGSGAYKTARIYGISRTANLIQGAFGISIANNVGAPGIYNERLFIDGSDGHLLLNGYGDGDITGVMERYIAVSSSGKLIERTTAQILNDIGAGTQTWFENVNGLHYNDGNIGIGISTPNNCLDIYKSVAGDVAVQIQNVSSAAAANAQLILSSQSGIRYTKLHTSANLVWPGACLEYSSASNWSFYNSGSGSIEWWNGGAKRLSLLGNGNLGVGVASPSEKLHVNGNLNVAGNITQAAVGNVTYNYGNSLLVKSLNDQPFQLKDSSGFTYAQFSPANGDFQTYSLMIHNGSAYANAIKKTAAGAGLLLGNASWNRIATTNPVVIGSETILESAVLDVSSTTGVFYPPRMTTTQRDAIPAVSNGAIIYNILTDTFQGRAAGSWVDFH